MGNPDYAGVPWLLHQAVADQAVRHPGRVAVASGNNTLTYAELLENASAVASGLRAAGVRPELTVAACLPRGLALAPAVLGTWLAGGAYLPLAPDSPPQRRDYILRNSSPAAIIATEDTAPAFTSNTSPVVILEGTGAVRWPDEQRATSHTPVSPADLAYVIYTSGSTGWPKGVLVEHGNLAAMARSHEAILYGGQGRNISHVALNNVTIADSFFSDFAHLAYSRTLHVVDDAARRDPDRLAQFITGHAIEVLDATPTQIQTLVLAGHASCLSALTVLVVGGEPTSPELWSFLSKLPGVAPYNLYGPTECTVAVTAAAMCDHPSPVLGAPLPGCGAWVIDDGLRQVPDGQAGELLITGDQVARGYLNAAPADAARFVHFRPPDGNRTVRGYRTGDRGRVSHAGQLEFLGRTDNQVSIGGYRVEIGEVETVLRECVGVRAAAVGARRDRHETTLVAYAVFHHGTEVEDVRTQLAAALPPHMIPVITAVPEIPMGPTGKADFTSILEAFRQATRQEEEKASTWADGGVALEVADIVQRIWCETLGIASVLPADDFFVLGGDSVKATRVIVEIRDLLASDIPIRTLFENPTLQEFCDAIRVRPLGAADTGGEPA